MKDLGVSIGLAKSLISRNGVGEFAKRYFIPSDASPISLKEVSVAFHSSSNLCELALKRKSVRLADVLTFLGYGYRAVSSITKKYNKMPTRMRNWILTLTYPGQVFGRTLDDWLRGLTLTNSSARDLVPTYRSLVGLMTERLHARLKTYQPFIDRA